MDRVHAGRRKLSTAGRPLSTIFSTGTDVTTTTVTRSVCSARSVISIMDLFRHLRGDVFDFVRQERRPSSRCTGGGRRRVLRGLISCPFSSAVGYPPTMRRAVWRSRMRLSWIDIQRGDLIADSRVTKAGRSRIVVDR